MPGTHRPQGQAWAELPGQESETQNRVRSPAAWPALPSAGRFSPHGSQGLCRPLVDQATPEGPGEPLRAGQTCRQVLLLGRSVPPIFAWWQNNFLKSWLLNFAITNHQRGKRENTDV